MRRRAYDAHVQDRVGPFGRFLARRLLSAILIVFIVASATLVLSAGAQGDFASTTLGIGAPPASVTRLRASLGLDRTVLAIYVDWLAHAARFDFGRSLVYQRPVAPFVAERAANTAVLAIVALALAAGIGIPLGILTGSRRGVLTSIVRGASALCISVPPLIGAILLVALAAATGLAPVGGMTTLAAAPGSLFDWWRDVAAHVPLPALALALPFVATFERVQSQAIAEALAEPSVTAALARGLTPRQVLWRHAWRLSARPVAAIGGLMIGTIISGSFAVELVMAWPGLGRLTYDALRARDLYLAAGCATAAAVFLAVGILASDILLAAIDPRTVHPADEDAARQVSL
jgi:peptide/nickel transport system permease protein